MKWCVLFVVLLTAVGNIQGQSFVRSVSIEVTSNKTSNLIFPSAISTVDRGSERIIVQKSTGNVLRVKADTCFSDTTNLTVITADGKLYSFLVSYAASPSALNVDLGAASNIHRDTALVSLAQRVKQSNNLLHGFRYNSGKVFLSLQGIYTNGSLIACKVRIENVSALSFEIGRISAVAMGGRNLKRRASHEEVVAIQLADIESTLVRERQAAVAVIIVPKSGLSPGQKLELQVQEKGADRYLRVSIPNRYLLNAYLIQ